MKTIAIINQKGGVGKSTTAGVLAAGLNRRGYKTLAVDLDPQRNLTLAAGINGSPNIEDVLQGHAKNIQEVIQHTAAGDVIAASGGLASADNRFTDIGKEYLLKKPLAALNGEYDYCIIDTPPSLGILTINALNAADYVLIPAQADIFSVQGVKELEKTLAAVKEYLNPHLKTAGIVVTRYSSRATLNREVLQLLNTTAKQLDTKVYATQIREGVAIREAQAVRTDLFTYAPKAAVTADYNELITELLKDIERSANE